MSQPDDPSSEPTDVRTEIRTNVRMGYRPPGEAAATATTATGPAADRFRRADGLLDQALDLPPGERAPFLDRASAGDPELRSLVERLLVGAETGAADIEPGAGLEFFKDVRGDAEREDRMLGTVVDGRYRIVRELGRGGMSIVYLAERIDEFEQQVALKVLKHGLETKEAVRRFEQERQILAAARHPGMALLLDGGVGPGGRPYLAMEHVEGRPIDVYCDEERLGIPERLRLFLQVARAVEAAHRSLIVHRDIKPSNILVTADGHAKLLDFGIAKLLDPVAGASAPVTRTSARLLTPAYASPEQVRGGPVTTASDVYQLGLLLYLLLTGRFPYHVGSGPGEAAEAIAGEVPVRPSSAALAALPATSILRAAPAGGHREAPRPQAETGEIAAARSTTPGRLRRRLAGDLDAILLAALDKEPERRYGSVGQLVDDIERHLAGRPVRLRAGSWTYRAGKFLRRHAAAVGTAAVVLLVFAALAIGYSADVARERNQARHADQQSKQIAAYLRSLFVLATPSRLRGEQVTAKQILDRGVAHIDRDLEGRPELQAELLTMLGDVYRELAFFDEATRLLNRAVTLRRARPGPGGLDLAASLDAFGRVREAMADHGAARKYFEEARDLREAALGPGDAQVARTLDGLGTALAGQGDYDGARRLHARAYAVLSRTLGPDDPEAGLALLHLGRALGKGVHLLEARKPMEKAVAVLEAGYGPEHPYVAAARIDLANLYHAMGETRRARQEYEQALPVVERAYGVEHPLMASSLATLGDLQREEGDAAGALARYRQALAIRTAALGPGNPGVAELWRQIGLAQKQQGERAEARRSLTTSARIYEAALGTGHGDLSVPLYELAELDREDGRTAEARQLYERVLALRERAYGAGSTFLVLPLYQVGSLSLAAGDPREAEALLRRGLAITASQQGTGHGGELLEVELGRALIAQQRFREAMALLNPLANGRRGSELGRRRALTALVELNQAAGRPQEVARLQAELAALGPAH